MHCNVSTNIIGRYYNVYENQRIYIKYVLTHADYDKDKWKNDPYF
nr:type II toxin-antitoxin system HigB family toxin [Nostoc sp. PCC 7107]